MSLLGPSRYIPTTLLSTGYYLEADRHQFKPVWQATDFSYDFRGRRNLHREEERMTMRVWSVDDHSVVRQGSRVCFGLKLELRVVRGCRRL